MPYPSILMPFRGFQSNPKNIYSKGSKKKFLIFGYFLSVFWPKNTFLPNGHGRLHFWALKMCGRPPFVVSTNRMTTISALNSISKVLSRKSRCQILGPKIPKFLENWQKVPFKPFISQNTLFLANFSPKYTIIWYF